MRLPYCGCLLLAAITLQGCGWFEPKPSVSPAKPEYRRPRAMLKRVPCKIKMGPLAATLEVDLKETKALLLDMKDLLEAIVTSGPSQTPPERSQPVMLVINKSSNTFTYFHLTPHIRQVSLRNKDAKELDLVVKNQEPLSLELWIDSPNDVELEVEFKDDDLSQDQ